MNVVTHFAMVGALIFGIGMNTFDTFNSLKYPAVKFSFDRVIIEKDGRIGIGRRSNIPALPIRWIVLVTDVKTGDEVCGGRGLDTVEEVSSNTWMASSLSSYVGDDCEAAYGMSIEMSTIIMWLGSDTKWTFTEIISDDFVAVRPLE